VTEPNSNQTIMNDNNNETLPPVPPRQETTSKTSVVFNALHPDGVFRPIWICPGIVTSVRKLNPTYKIDKAEAHTAIQYKEGDSFAGFGKSYEVFVYEDIAEVLGSLGTAVNANMWYGMHFMHAGQHFESQGIKYCAD